MSGFHMSILRNFNVALSNLRHGHVTLSNLRNCHVPCHYLLKTHVYVTKPQKAPCRRVDFRGLGPYMCFCNVLRKSSLAPSSWLLYPDTQISWSYLSAGESTLGDNTGWLTLTTIVVGVSDTKGDSVHFYLYSANSVMITDQSRTLEGGIRIHIDWLKYCALVHKHLLFFPLHVVFSERFGGVCVCRPPPPPLPWISPLNLYSKIFVFKDIYTHSKGASPMTGKWKLSYMYRFCWFLAVSPINCSDICMV